MTDDSIKTLKHYEKPAQKSPRDALDILNGDMVGLYKRKSVGLLSSEQEKELRDKKKQKATLTKKLQTRIGEEKRSRRNRRGQHEKISRDAS